MGRLGKKLAVAAALVAAGAAWAAPEDAATLGVGAPQGTLETSPTGGTSTARITGWYDLRPSLAPGQTRAEHEVAGLVAFGGRYQLGYVQRFWTPFTNAQGQGYLPDEGWLHFDAARLFTARQFDLNYQARAVLPTAAGSPARGYLGQFRQHVEGSWRARPWLTLQLREGVIAEAFKKNAEGDAGRIPTWDNRAEFEVALQPFGEQWKIRLPLLVQTRLFRMSPETEGRNVGHELWVEPEITYAFSNNLTFGAAYYSAALVGEDLGLAATDRGFKNGVYQLIMAASL